MSDTNTTPPREFVRPAKSPARRTGGSGGESIEASVRQMAGQAYDSVPDMGVQRTLQNAYNGAPDLGIQSAIARTTGYGATSSASTGEEQAARSGRREAGSIDDDDDTAALSPYDISRQRGPSNQDRIGKSQREIGTEHSVPTRAGYGTTLSPDKTNAAAAESYLHKPMRAIVPDDYAPEPVRDSEHTSSRHSRNYSSDRTAVTTGTSTPRSNASSTERKRRSFGEKLRDQVRGEMKILAGSLTNNEKTIVQGLNIKHGEVA